jgi:hypothetical protein
VSAHGEHAIIVARPSSTRSDDLRTAITGRLGRSDTQDFVCSQGYNNNSIHRHGPSYMGFARYDEAAILMSFEELRAVGEDAGADLIERFPPPRVSVRLQNPAAARRQSTSL